MCRLRLKAQDDLGRGSCAGCFLSSFVEHAGIQVVVEVGLGLGVFAGDAIGIGNTVRHLSAPWWQLASSHVKSFIDVANIAGSGFTASAPRGRHFSAQRCVDSFTLHF